MIKHYPKRWGNCRGTPICNNNACVPLVEWKEKVTCANCRRMLGLRSVRKPTNPYPGFSINPPPRGKQKPREPFDEKPRLPGLRIYSLTAKFQKGWGKNYTWACDLWPCPNVGDHVVVETVNGLKVVEVTGLSSREPYKGYAWVICKVDLVAHNCRMRIRQRERNRAEIANLKDRIKELEKDNIY